MSDSTAERLKWANAHNHFLTHLAIMPAWHKAVILIGGLLAVLGTVGQIAAKVGGDAHVRVTTGSVPTAANGSKLVDDNQPAKSDQPTGSLSVLSPHATRIGLSIVLGFVIGWLFRAFLKTMALFAIVVGGTIWLLAHFDILHLGDANIDAIREKTAGAASWLGVKGSHLKELAIAHLPSSGGGTLGAFLGLRRR